MAIQRMISPKPSDPQLRGIAPGHPPDNSEYSRSASFTFSRRCAMGKPWISLQFWSHINAFRGRAATESRNNLRC